MSGMSPYCSLYWIYNAHNQASIINSTRYHVFLTPAYCARTMCPLGNYPRLLQPGWTPLFRAVVSSDPHKLRAICWSQSLDAALESVGYNNLFSFYLFFIFYLFCFSSNGARVPDSCCTPYSSIWSGQMRIVETASGRRVVAPTPVKRCQRGSEGFLWLRGVLLLLMVLLGVKHQTRCGMLSRRW